MLKAIYRVILVFPLVVPGLVFVGCGGGRGPEQHGIRQYGLCKPCTE